MSDNYYHFPGAGNPELNEKGRSDLLNWYHALHDNKGERAKLRRCESPEQVMLTQGFRKLYYNFAKAMSPEQQPGKADRFMALACAAGVVAHVRAHQSGAEYRFAKQMGKRKRESDKPQVSELRFSKLQKSHSWDEFYRGLIRTVKLIGGEVDVLSLVDDIFHWGKEFSDIYDRKPMNRLHVRWAAEYYDCF